MKKLRVFLIIISVVFLLGGAGIQGFLHFKNLDIFPFKNNGKNADESSSVTGKDFLNSKNLQELNSMAEEAGLNVKQETDLNGNKTVVVSGYNFNGFESEITFYQNNDSTFDHFESEIIPYKSGQDVNAADLKEKCEAAAATFAQRFGIPSDGFNIRKQDGNTVEKNDANSYKLILDGEAKLEYYVKDSNGFIWFFTAYREPSYNTIVFHLNCLMDTSKTGNMYCDIDLTQSGTEGNGQ